MPGSPLLQDRVLECVDLIPPGRVLSYSDVAEYAGTRSARAVGRILAADAAAVNWHRVLRADGTCAEHLCGEQVRRLRSEGVPFRGNRVDMAAARWSGH
jgi:methylated-DNA-protein-cysteine methyltransferase-like protein